MEPLSTFSHIAFRIHFYSEVEQVLLHFKEQNASAATVLDSVPSQKFIPLPVTQI